MNEFEAFRLVWIVYFLFGLSAMWIPYSGWSDVLKDNRVDVLVAICSLLHQTLACIICGGNKKWPTILFLCRLCEGGGFVFLSILQTGSAAQLAWALLKFIFDTSRDALLEYVAIFSFMAVMALINLAWSVLLSILVIKKRCSDLDDNKFYQRRNQALKKHFPEASAQQCLEVLSSMEETWGHYNGYTSLSENSFLTAVFFFHCTMHYHQPSSAGQQQPPVPTCSICDTPLLHGDLAVEADPTDTGIPHPPQGNPRELGHIGKGNRRLTHTDCTVRRLLQGRDTTEHRRHALRLLRPVPA